MPGTFSATSAGANGVSVLQAIELIPRANNARIDRISERINESSSLLDDCPFKSHFPDGLQHLLRRLSARIMTDMEQVAI
jgi:hypothetical protein